MNERAGKRATPFTIVVDCTDCDSLYMFPSAASMQICSKRRIDCWCGRPFMPFASKRQAGYLTFSFVVLFPFARSFLLTQPKVHVAMQTESTATTDCELSFSKSDQPAPLYITIGPPCAGKTTWLQQQQRHSPDYSQVSIDDVSLDDQPDTYVPLNTEYFLTNTANSYPEELRTHCICGKSLAERIQGNDQRELRTVLQRVAGNLTESEFRNAIIGNIVGMDHCESTTSKSVQTLLVNAVERCMQDQTMVALLPQTVDLFVRERIFRRDGTHSTTGLESSEKALYACPIDRPVAWGNTNTRPSDYRMALVMAASTRRPVRFVVYSDKKALLRILNNSEMDLADKVPQELFGLQATLPELIDRNVNRLLTSGRYVPVSVIRDMHERSLELLQKVVHGWNSLSRNHSNNSKLTAFDLDRGLARLVDFDLLADRTVVDLRTVNQPPQQQQQHQGNNLRRSSSPRPLHLSARDAGSRKRSSFDPRSRRQPPEPVRNGATHSRGTRTDTPLTRPVDGEKYGPRSQGSDANLAQGKRSYGGYNRGSPANSNHAGRPPQNQGDGERPRLHDQRQPSANNTRRSTFPNKTNGAPPKRRRREE